MGVETLQPPNKTESHEQISTTSELVLRCIDFRTNERTAKWLARRGHQEGNYQLFASAGASGNPNGFLETVTIKQPELIKAIDHEDCGFYKANGFYSLFEEHGHAPHEAHHHNLEVLASDLHRLNPNTEYRYNLLPLNKKERQRHTAAATAIILGKPHIVKAANDDMKKLSIFNSHDVIARPYILSPHDETVWVDLDISQGLHNPKKIYIFDEDAENLEALAAAADRITGLPVERKLVPAAV